MASYRATISPLLVLAVLVLAARATEDPPTYRTYIVFVSRPADAEAMTRRSFREWHESFLPRTPTASGENRLVCSYSAIFHGFAARLTEAELAEVAKRPGFLRALPDSTNELLTTRTPGFLGLSMDGDGTWSDTNFGRGTIVGILDSGIYGRHSSFGDDGVPEPPSRWKGACTGSDATRCNRKLVGSKSFAGDADPIDDEEHGHGTHVASIAAGNFVAGAALDGGLGFGTASGIAPHAHIAMYKVCTSRGCDESAIACGMEEAVQDGVDVINLSITSRLPRTFDNDPKAIGAFHAMAKGILVVAAAGNIGPSPHTVFNEAPWMLTVGAGSVDRHFEAQLEYDTIVVDGETLVQSPALEGDYGVVDGDYCVEGQLAIDLKNKLVICRTVTGEVEGASQAEVIKNVKNLGAAGVILIDHSRQGYTTALTTYDGFNVITVNNYQGKDLIGHYGNSTGILSFNSAVLGLKPSPAVAYFSSRGPGQLSRGLLKPDVIAPGLNIIAASSARTAGPSRYFKVLSGTSMAAPHVTGLVALLKTTYPDWSPSAIKSAIMTNTNMVDNTDLSGPILDEQHKEAARFTVGAGQINPIDAMDPGLVYDIDARQYAAYICGLLGEDALPSITNSTCSDVGVIPEMQLNLPTIMVPLRGTEVTVVRTLTNVGSAETYHSYFFPVGMDAKVSPETLVFSQPGERLSFNVSVTANSKSPKEAGEFVEAILLWWSPNHQVRSPIIAVVGL